MISVIITVHEPLLKHLSRCVDSVLWQLAEEDEVLIIGDGCDLQALCEVSFVSHPIRYFPNARGRGVAAARNEGLGNARGQWVKYLDADDLLAPFALNALRYVAPKVGDTVGVIAGTQLKIHNGLFVGEMPPPDIDAVIPRANPLLVSMAAVRRSAALAVAGFDERMDFEEDWDFWLRLRRAGQRFAIHRRPFCCYVIDDAERAAKVRTHTVDGVPVRKYLAETYGITPQ